MYRVWVIIGCWISVSANAAGYGSPIQGASGLGNAYAGAAASAVDATTIFANPAGMIYLNDSQFIEAIHVVKPESRFEDEGSIKGAGVPPRGGEGGDIGSWIFVPNLFYAKKISPDLSMGLGVNSPFGLKTEYDDDWVGRFQTVKSQLRTINFNPSIAFRVNDSLSVGAGISAMYARAELTRAVNRVVSPESFVKIKGDDWGYGFNLGLIYQVTEDTRLGLAYRSKVEQNLKGEAKFDAPLQALNTNVKTSITTPETVSFSTYSQLNDKWDLLTDITWTRWSRFEEIKILRENGSLLSLTPQNWDNSLRYSMGATYKYDSKLNLRAGIAYDEEAISDEFRTARIPSNDRTWLSVGASWQMSEKSKLDVGFSHLFIKDAVIDDDQNSPAEGFNGRLRGKYQAQANILGIQFTRTLD